VHPPLHALAAPIKTGLPACLLLINAKIMRRDTDRHIGFASLSAPYSALTQLGDHTQQIFWSALIFNAARFLDKDDK
jgi:hypothetical protein